MADCKRVYLQDTTKKEAYRQIDVAGTKGEGSNESRCSTVHEDAEPYRISRFPLHYIFEVCCGFVDTDVIMNHLYELVSI